MVQLNNKKDLYRNIIDMMNRNKPKQTTNNQFVHSGNSKESHCDCHANNL